MKLETFEAKRETYKLNRETPLMVRVTARREWNNKQTGQISHFLEVGQEVGIFFSERYPGSIFIKTDSAVLIGKVSFAHKYLEGFRKPPTMKTLNKWSWDGIARSVLNQKVEPDGWDCFGSPSYLLVYGII
jgi:hypothetical protein